MAHESFTARRLVVVPGRAAYGFENLPIDDHQFGILMQGARAFAFEVLDNGIGFAALGHGAPAALGDDVIFRLRPLAVAPYATLEGYDLGSSASPFSGLYVSAIGLINSGTGHEAGITFPDAGRGPVTGELLREGNDLKYDDGTIEYTLNHAAAAPDTADYLVGTTQAGLSAEIVVGTSPGGELGGTWGTPTVDATHSGSSHQVPVDVESDVTFSDATLGDITGMSFAVAASTKYVFQFHLFLRSVEDGGIKFDFTVPASPTAAAVRYIVNDLTSHFSSTNIADLTTDFEVAGASLDTNAIVSIYGWFSNGANAGTVQLRGAQQTDTGTSLIVSQGSHGLYGIVT